jgi:hypothetical protein
MTESERIMKTYTMKKVHGEPDWDTIPRMHLDEQMWIKNDTVTATAQVCWDEEALYIRLQAKEKDLRIQETGLTAEVCLDSCLEFFVRPTEKLDYFNFEFNPKCVMYLGYGNGVNGAAELIRLLVRNPESVFCTQSEIDPEGWQLRFRIPYNFIRRFFPDFAPKEGGQMYANAYKCGNIERNNHFLAWNPVNVALHSFHRPQEFGCLIFGGK